MKTTPRYVTTMGRDVVVAEFNRTRGIWQQSYRIKNAKRELREAIEGRHPKFNLRQSRKLIAD